MTMHGGNIFQFMKRTGLPMGDIIDFSASINPLGPPESVMAAIGECLKNLAHYPDPDSTELREEIAAAKSVDPDMIICGNGCVELIHLIARTFRFKKILIPVPTFAEYERASRIACPRAGIGRLKLSPSQSFDISPERVFAKAAEYNADAVFLCNPNNPTGRLIEGVSLLELVQRLKKQKIYSIVDESFIDFCPGESIMASIKRNPYAIVLRSMTKFYALPGLRLGYAVASPAVIRELNNRKEPWSTNTLAQAAGVAALRDEDYRKKTIEIIADGRVFLEDSFRGLYIEHVPSSANYCLLKIPGARNIAEGLAASGIMVRDCSPFPGLDSSYLRVAVRSPEENRKLIKRFKILLSSQ